MLSYDNREVNAILLLFIRWELTWWELTRVEFKWVEIFRQFFNKKIDKNTVKEITDHIEKPMLRNEGPLSYIMAHWCIIVLK